LLIWIKIELPIAIDHLSLSSPTGAMTVAVFPFEASYRKALGLTPTQLARQPQLQQLLQQQLADRPPDRWSIG
jgi:hypothetical protein